MATAPCPCCFSSSPPAATYHHPFPYAFPSPIPSQIGPSWPSAVPTPIHGDLHNASFPSFYSAPPAFPYAATYHYPPSAATFPNAGTYPYPPPACAYTPVTGFSPAPAYDPSILPSAATSSCPTSEAIPIPTNVDADWPPPASSRETPQPNATTTTTQPWAALAPSPEFDPRAPQNGDLSSTVACTNRCSMDSSSSVFATDLPAPTYSNHRFVKQQVQTLSSLKLLQGELPKLSPLVSQFAVARGMETTEAPVTGPSLAVTPVQFKSPATTASMFSGTGATASSSASSLSSADASATADVVLQMFEEMPQQYGLHNLDRGSLFRADGTEHSYFTLPADYPLERAVPQPVFAVYDDKLDGYSTESVHMFTGTPEQLTYDEEQHENRQDLKCFSKPVINPGRPTDGIFSFPNEKKSDTALHTVCFSTSVNTFSEEATDLNILHSPVIPADKSIKLTKEKSTQAASTLCVHEETVQLGAPPLCLLVIHERRKEWDPGDTQFHVLYTTAAGATNRQCTNVYKFAIVHMQSLMSSTVTDQIQFQALERKPIYDVFSCALEQHQQLYEDERSINVFEERHVHEKLSMEMSDVKLLFTCSNKVPVDNSMLALPWSQCPVLAEYNSTDVCIWDLGIGISSSIYHWLQSLTAATEKPLSSLQTPEPVPWLSQVSSASYVWDPGTVLLQYKSIWLLLFTEERKRVTLIPKQWSCWWNAMHYCKIFQRCTAMSSLFHYHGIPLWLINFQVP